MWRIASHAVSHHLRTITHARRPLRASLALTLTTLPLHLPVGVIRAAALPRRTFPDRPRAHARRVRRDAAGSDAEPAAAL